MTHSRHQKAMLPALSAVASVAPLWLQAVATTASLWCRRATGDATCPPLLPLLPPPSSLSALSRAPPLLPLLPPPVGPRQRRPRLPPLLPPNAGPGTWTHGSGHDPWNQWCPPVMGGGGGREGTALVAKEDLTVPPCKGGWGERERGEGA